ncbi:GNAT family N-acetyltransferase [Ktedonospora formicarum]|uniref:N-acetyltransferase n=1 Tax=Ktedonospora formicarum TaxID=2778364 RepID=A0A8J3MT49_9CHLR|nr:GNAT family protein [Ktedonospora formicarum]GHO46795.1 N-acetyltransferase [Ktedonospora formicarum]
MSGNEENREKKEYAINVVGEGIALGPMHLDIVPLMYKWINDFEVSLLSGDPLIPRSLEAVKADVEQDLRDDQHHRIGFIIYERVGMRMIGITELRHLDHIHRKATFGILIGMKDCWHKGYGTEATRLMLDYGFTVLGLHNIELRTYSYNTAAQRAYTKAGFRVVGTRHEACCWGGQFYDEIIMECLSNDFKRINEPIIRVPNSSL